MTQADKDITPGESDIAFLYQTCAPALLAVQGRTLRQRLGILAAVVVLVALVGSLALLFSATRLHPGGPASGEPHPVASSTAVRTSVSIAVTPGSVAGLPCGTPVTVSYTATIHVAANSPGGTVTFEYTVNNGRSQNMVSVHFAADQTSRTYTLTWSGPRPADHTYPEPGGISVTSPNALLSPLVGPSGMCH